VNELSECSMTGRDESALKSEGEPVGSLQTKHVGRDQCQLPQNHLPPNFLPNTKQINK
jgi:hypothetical protein